MANWIDILAVVCLGAALLQSVLAQLFHTPDIESAEPTIGLKLFHFLAFEIEGCFIVWTLAFLAVLTVGDFQKSVELVANLRFAEAGFIVVMMVICSSHALAKAAARVFGSVASCFTGPKAAIFLVITLTLGPLLGSFLTEPAAMTIVAVILLRRFLTSASSEEFKYALLATLFVNVSIGGTLTPFAAPPVLMVAHQWNWNSIFMLTHFGWKGFEACLVSSIWLAYHFREEIGRLEWNYETQKWHRHNFRALIIDCAVLVLLLLARENVWQIAMVFAVFLLLHFFVKDKATRSSLNLRSSVGVGLFLASVIVLSSRQSWWLEPLVSRLSSFTLYVSTILLTGVVDNAAITSLGAQLPHLTGDQKYLLVAGSVVGGGLTLMANAPNLIGYSILRAEFAKSRFSMRKLFRAALLPTLIAALAYSIL